MGFYETVNHCLSKPLDFNGRASRSEFWYFVLFVSILKLMIYLFALLFPAAVMSISQEFQEKKHVWIPLSIVIVLYISATHLAVSARRLHDRGFSGYWLLPTNLIIPVIFFLSFYSNYMFNLPVSVPQELGLVLLSFIWFGFALFLVIMYILPGQTQINKYGPGPEASRVKHEIGAIAQIPRPLGDEIVDAVPSKSSSEIADSVSPSRKAKALRPLDTNSPFVQGPNLEDPVKNSPEITSPAAKNDLEETAKLAIEYDPITASAWQEIQNLPLEFQERFIKGIGTKPDQDANALAAELKASHLKKLRPYADEATNDVLEQVRTISPDAEAEFREVYALLGNRLAVAELLIRIEEKFGVSDTTKARQEAVRLEQERLEQERLEQEQIERENRQRAWRKMEERHKRERLEKKSKTKYFWRLLQYVFVISLLGLLGSIIIFAVVS